jgi:DNA polymerase-3 subunit delta
LEDAAACIGDSAATSLDGVVYAACGGDQRGLDLALGRTLGEGVHPVGILRAAARHLQRLHLAAGMMIEGRSADQAMKALRPPVIYTYHDRFRVQLRLWNTDRLAGALDLITEAELDCKTTGLPAEAVCGRALMRMTQAAKAR